jgi:NAD/NADP transhydrogenase beta subunit
MNPHLVSYVVSAIVIVALLALRMRRMGRDRPLKIDRLWVTPTIYLAIVVILLAQTPPDEMGWLWSAVGLVVGAVIGWYRGRMISISVDPVTQALKQRASPAAMIFLAVLVAARVFLRALAANEAQTWHVSAATIVDAFLTLALGVIAVQRLEMFLRARRLLAGAAATN